MTMNIITKSDEIFLKKFLIDFYHKIIDTKDFSTFEDVSIKWIKKILENYDKNPENFFKMMQNHKKHQIWFTSIMGFFFQHGIGCDVNTNIALELYLLIVNNKINEKFLNDNQLHLIKENGNEDNKLQDINIIIGKYLLSLFYYKDIILDKRKLINLVKRKSINKFNQFKKFKSIFTKKKYLKKIFKDDNGKIDNHVAQRNENLDVKNIIEVNMNAVKSYLKSQVNTNVKDIMGDYNQSDDGIETNDKKDFKIIKKSAITGDVNAQCSLGYCYYSGKGIDKNEKEAFEWFLKSAEGGSTIGQNYLGYCYINGKGIGKNEKKAFEWFLKSVEDGSKMGQNNLGYCYLNGKGIDKNEKKAFEWFLKSAEGGSKMGQNSLGYCYLNGIGTDKDEKKAFEWFLKSAEGGSKMGQNNLGYCYLNGKGTDKNEKKAVKWFLKSAEGGSSIGQNYLGHCYLNGKGIDKNEKKAFEWFLKSADNGNSLGQSNLGYCYLNGKGIDKNKKKAFELFLKSANKGCSSGQYYLGYCNKYGMGTKKNIKDAIRWYEITLGNGKENRLIRNKLINDQLIKLKQK